MDYERGKFGLPREWKSVIVLFALLLSKELVPQASAILTEGQPENATQVTGSETAKREVAQRREHSFNSDGTVNYHGSGSGHDSGDLVPPTNGGIFNPSAKGPIHSGSSSFGLSNSYGVPIPPDSYGPPKNVFDDSFGQPPSDSYAPPPRPGPSLPKPVYGPPKLSKRPSRPRPSWRPPSPPKGQYGPPKLQFGSSKPQFILPPKPAYGPPRPPKISFNSRPKPSYGPPKITFGGPSLSHGTLLSPVSQLKNQYGPPRPNLSYGTPLAPSISYGPPSKGPHGGAPPTPPEIKYDGWKPMPGLISQPPSDSYGPPGGSPPAFIETHIVSGGSGGGFGGGGFSTPSSNYGTPSFSSSFGGLSSGPSSSYGPPSSGPSSSYGPPSSGPSSSYGPPSSGPSSSYGPPSSGPSISFGHPPSKPSGSYGVPPPSVSYGPPKKPSSTFGSLPSSSYGVPRPPGGSFSSSPATSYGPPRKPGISFGSSPSSSYGPPRKPSISLTSPPSSSYGPPQKPTSSFGSSHSKPSFGISLKPSTSYGLPKPPSSSYGAPSAGPSFSHSSSSFSFGSNPSGNFGSLRPPKITNTYGLPQPPSTSYGTPNTDISFSAPKPSSSYGVPGQSNTGLSYPASGLSYGGPPPSQSLPSSYGVPVAPSASFGLPAVPVAQISGCCGTAPPDLALQAPVAVYGAPSSTALPVVPAIEYGTPQPQHISSDISSGSTSHSSPNLPVIYGTPLLPTANTDFSSNTFGNAGQELPLMQPKHPVKFRPPVPMGLISSLGSKWGDATAWGGDTHAHKFHGSTYIPPAVPDPDPGTQTHEEPALVVPPPSAPSSSYGTPKSASVHAGITNEGVQEGHTATSSHDISSSLSVQPSTSFDIPTQLLAQDPAVPFSTSSLKPYDAFSGSAGVQDIPIKGNQGTYTLQIQPAGGNQGEDSVPHHEVLSEGLLQDILSAIENPSQSSSLQQYGTQEGSDPETSVLSHQILNQLGLQSDVQIQQSAGYQPSQNYAADLQHSPSNNIITFEKHVSNEKTVNIPTSKSSSSGAHINSSASENKISRFLSDNQVALYFNMQPEGEVKSKGDVKDIVLVQMTTLPDNTTSTNFKSVQDLVSYTIESAQSSNGTVLAGETQTSEKKAFS